MDRDRRPYRVMIAFFRLIPQPGIDDRDNALIGKTPDQPPDPLFHSYYATYIWSGPEGAFSVVESYEQNNQRLQNLYTLGNTEGMAAYNVILDQLIRENYTKMITGDTPVDSFDDFAAQWASLGGEQITREVNELIGR